MFSLGLHRIGLAAFLHEHGQLMPAGRPPADCSGGETRDVVELTGRDGACEFTCRLFGNPDQNAAERKKKKRASWQPASPKCAAPRFVIDYPNVATGYARPLQGQPESGVSLNRFCTQRELRSCSASRPTDDFSRRERPVTQTYRCRRHGPPPVTTSAKVSPATTGPTQTDQTRSSTQFAKYRSCLYNDPPTLYDHNTHQAMIAATHPRHTQNRPPSQHLHATRQNPRIQPTTSPNHLIPLHQRFRPPDRQPTLNKPASPQYPAFCWGLGRASCQHHVDYLCRSKVGIWRVNARPAGVDPVNLFLTNPRASCVITKCLGPNRDRTIPARYGGSSAHGCGSKRLPKEFSYRNAPTPLVGVCRTSGRLRSSKSDSKSYHEMKNFFGIEEFRRVERSGSTPNILRV